MSLFSLQGFLRLAPLDPVTGKIGALRWVGNVPEATLALTSSNADKTESYSGKRLQIGRLATGQTAAFNFTMDEWSTANLALAFQAAQQDIATSTVTGEVFPSALVAGDQVRLEHPFVSSLAITDSAATPATVPPANYALEGHSKAVVRIVSPGAFTQPFKAAYSYAAAKSLVMFAAPSKVVYGQFDGINTETDEPVLIDLWRLRFDPVASLGLINAEYGNLPMTSAVLYDQARATDPMLGGFGRMQTRASAP